ncbi:ATP-binding protein [Spirosoma aerophilum]
MKTWPALKNKLLLYPIILLPFFPGIYSCSNLQQQGQTNPIADQAKRTVVADTLLTSASMVSDHRTGIPESVRAKIFPPFFTTKSRGEGTGLGLSLSYDIVTKGHGEKLEVEATGDKGTTFLMTI